MRRNYPGELGSKMPLKGEKKKKGSKFKGLPFIFPLTLCFGETTVISGCVRSFEIFNGSGTDPEEGGSETGYI